MNGVHDMGGMDGFGPVLPEQNEPVFHADWERRVFAIMNHSFGFAGFNIDEFRHAIERIPPARYLASSYYERWLGALETLMVERGVVTREELIAKQSPGVDTESLARAVKTNPPAPSKDRARAKSPRARFVKGDSVRARNLNPSGHTRLPRYVRGKRGVIVRDWGVFVFPDTNAHHAGTRPQHCYSVSFDARELWGKSAERGRLNIDLWEDYLEADRTNSPKQKTKSPTKIARIGRKSK
ncbi:MAG: nitrile hydratase subunit beta [Candidatus Binatus sp.]|uniref:nitrile hydratase subunit beta n=1 Tax=Candidatus Binatus sp. TaxID=2811406 RepID=UPI00271BB113|nr:nitrile hydratase subunit beta [Candidatus Binatus sp.]MDO8433284.1 nitrile hydratase subunit beta [Candidatus Binatus sp.]